MANETLANEINLENNPPDETQTEETSSMIDLQKTLLDIKDLISKEEKESTTTTTAYSHLVKEKEHLKLEIVKLKGNLSTLEEQVDYLTEQRNQVLDRNKKLEQELRERNISSSQLTLRNQQLENLLGKEKERTIEEKSINLDDFNRQAKELRSAKRQIEDLEKQIIELNSILKNERVIKDEENKKKYLKITTVSEDSYSVDITPCEVKKFVDPKIIEKNRRSFVEQYTGLRTIYCNDKGQYETIDWFVLTSKINGSQRWKDLFSKHGKNLGLWLPPISLRNDLGGWIVQLAFYCHLGELSLHGWIIDNENINPSLPEKVPATIEMDLYLVEKVISKKVKVEIVKDNGTSHALKPFLLFVALDSVDKKMEVPKVKVTILP